MKPELLVMTERGGFPEKFHYGFIYVIDEGYNCALKIGEDENLLYPFRSAAKPLQASVLIDSAVPEYFDFTGEELAIVCASHTGSAKHIETVANILQKIGLSPEYLQCGAHIPLDAEERQNLIKSGKEPLNLHNNCSGKHSGMLSVCIKNSLDIKTYLDENHPLQREIMKNIKKLCMLKEIPQTVSDGCSAPAPVLPHYNMGIGFLNLFLDDKCSAIKQAMSENPYLMGGKDRLDSEIIKASGGKLLAKVAAEGLCLVVNIEEKKVLLVKITDADIKARSIAVIESLKKLKWLDEDQIEASVGLKNLFNKEIKNLKNQIAGEIKTVFEF
ncbi:MAG TPA: asparaginase [Candidatus Gastranaerophilales bacterium]|nr:asparaginase [Candidatus Gastranaerophilales bacterium]